MEQYVTFNKILDYIQEYQESSPRMRTFGYGDIVYFATTNSGTTEFPLVFVTPLSVTYDENITTYNLSVIFGDIVNTDMSNEADVVSDMSLEAKRFISQIKRGFLFDKIDCQLPVTAIPFFERFNDHIGGVALDLNITVFEDINACDFYPTPTATASPTPTPTITQTPVGCSYYNIGNYGLGCSNFTWNNCDGSPDSIELCAAASMYICAQTGSVTVDTGGFITDTGSCPSPTPSATPTPTPTQP